MHDSSTRRLHIVALLAAVFLLASMSSASAVPEILYYPFAEGSGTTTANVASPGEGHANPSFTGTVTWQTGQVGAHAIDTTNGYIDTGWNTELTNSFTIEFWFYFQTQSLAWYPCGDANHGNFRFFTSGAGGTSMRVAGGGFTDTNFGANLHNDWFHFAFVYDATTNTTSAYVDGTYVGGNTGQFPTGGTSFGTFQVGSHNSGTRTFPGYLDEFRFWSQARTQSEIQQFMNVSIGGSDDLEFTLQGPVTAPVVRKGDTGPTGDGHVLADVTVRSYGEDWTVNEIEFTAGGSGDASTAFDQLALFEDTNSSGTFDGASIDLLATASAGIAFDATTDTYTAVLDDPDFPAFTSRRFFLVGRLNGTANGGETFTAAVTDTVATSPGTGVIDGLPTAYSDGIEIEMERLEVTHHGPLSTTNVPFDEDGTTGDGALLLTFSIETNDLFVIHAFDLRAFGTGDDAEHYAEVALYEDGGSNTWDGAANNTLVDNIAGFSQNDGTWIVSLSNPDFLPGTPRRFHVVGTLNGTAPNGRTFGVALDDVQVSSHTTYSATGLPLIPPAALNVRTPVSVTSFDPTTAPEFRTAPITITGTGFSLPMRVTIGTMDATGDAQVNENGTEVTGLNVPAGSGRDLQITVRVDGEPLIILEETFTYRQVVLNTNGGCGTSSTTTFWPFALPVLLVCLALMRRSQWRLAQG